MRQSSSSIPSSHRLLHKDMERLVNKKLNQMLLNAYCMAKVLKQVATISQVKHKYALYSWKKEKILWSNFIFTKNN